MAENRKKTKRPNEKPEDVMHGRSFEGADWAATEHEQTRHFRRVARHMPDESDEFVTDAELEVREANASPQDDEDDKSSED